MLDQTNLFALNATNYIWGWVGRETHVENQDTIL